MNVIINDAIESYRYFMEYENTDNDNLSFYEVFFYTDGITFNTEHNTMRDYVNPNSFMSYYMKLRDDEDDEEVRLMRQRRDRGLVDQLSIQWKKLRDDEEL